MDTTTEGPTGGGKRRLNHVELLHRPGERDLAVELFELLDFRCCDLDGGQFGMFLAAQVERSEDDLGNNVLYVSAAEPEQERMDCALQRNLAPGTGELADAWSAYDEMLQRRPHRAGHFGIRLSGPAEFEALVGRLEAIGDRLRSRIAVRAVHRPTPGEAANGNLLQAFVWTDIVASGLLTFGQQFELQAVPTVD